jgi:hypothetical protein
MASLNTAAKKIAPSCRELKSDRTLQARYLMLWKYDIGNKNIFLITGKADHPIFYYPSCAIELRWEQLIFRARVAFIWLRTDTTDGIL